MILADVFDALSNAVAWTLDLRPGSDQADWYASRLMQTAVLFAALGLARAAVERTLRSIRFDSTEEQLRWRVGVRDLLLLLLIVGLVLLWADALRSLVLSLFAVAAALTFGFRELFLSVSGALVRTSSNVARLGDRVEINGVRGDVIDRGLLSTTLREVGPGAMSHQWTGRLVVVPNTWFVSHAVAAETQDDRFLLHQFVVAIPREGDWERAEAALLEAAHAECDDYLDDARVFLADNARRRALESPAIDPRILMRLHDPGRIEMLLRLPVPSHQRGRTEQAIVRRFLTTMREPQVARVPVE
jgi:small-conductance mechanosensitive channel